jgi:hypothetical protein
MTPAAEIPSLQGSGPEHVPVSWELAALRAQAGLRAAAQLLVTRPDLAADERAAALDFAREAARDLWTAPETLPEDLRVFDRWPDRVAAVWNHLVELAHHAADHDAPAHQKALQAFTGLMTCLPACDARSSDAAVRALFAVLAAARPGHASLLDAADSALMVLADPALALKTSDHLEATPAAQKAYAQLFRLESTSARAALLLPAFSAVARAPLLEDALAVLRPKAAAGAWHARLTLLVLAPNEDAAAELRELGDVALFFVDYLRGLARSPSALDGAFPNDHTDAVAALRRLALARRDDGAWRTVLRESGVIPALRNLRCERPAVQQQAREVLDTLRA